MELTLLEYNLAHVLPSQVAAVALAFSLKALDSEDKPLSELWSTTLQYYSQYSLEEIAPTLKQVATIVQATTTSSGKVQAFGHPKEICQQEVWQDLRVPRAHIESRGRHGLRELLNMSTDQSVNIVLVLLSDI